MKNRGFTLFFVLVALAAIGIGFYFLYKYGNIPFLKSLQTTTSIKNNFYVPTAEKKYVLKHKESNGDKDIFSFTENENVKIAQWQNDIFFIDKTVPNTIKNINLQTNDLKTIYSTETSSGGMPYDISDLQVINNKLFFSLGGYLRIGGTYYISLPQLTKPIKLIESRNAKIENIAGRFWISSGEGDACWGQTDYFLLDENKLSAKKIVSSNSGCADGEEVIGIDSQNIYMGHHIAEATSDITTFKNVYTLKIDNPSQKEMLIPENKMPRNINGIRYISEENKLLLTGKESFIFNLGDRSLSTDSEGLKAKIDNKDYNAELIRKNKELMESLKLPNDYYFILK